MSERGMIERVARAQFACWRASMDRIGAHLDKGRSFEDMSDEEHQFALEMARAMIESMGEPTDAMLDADMDCGGAGYDGACETADPGAIWRAMINAALAEKP